MPGLSLSSTLSSEKHYSGCVLLVLVFVRQLLCKMSYALIISSVVLTTPLIAL